MRCPFSLKTATQLPLRKIGFLLNRCNSLSDMEPVTGLEPVTC